MSSVIDSEVGYLWLLNRLSLQVVQPLPVQTRAGTIRRTQQADRTEYRTIPEASRPDETLRGHLTFALKHEGVHLEALARIFAVVPAEEIEAWIVDEPTGQYARRVGFFYEQLTDKTLNVPALTMGNYVDALDPEAEFTNPLPPVNPKWRVRNNLLGDERFSPQVYKTPAVTEALQLDIAAEIAALEGKFGAEVVHRSAVWLTIKESRSSFAIEHEQDESDRVRRFAHVIGTQTGKGDNPYTPDRIESLQSAILGPKALHYGFRQSPIYVGERRGFGEEIVHYIAPQSDQLPNLMAGLAESWERTSGLPTLVRATIASFGFVYIHPMKDGNGRISRFLINDVFRRDGALKEPFIIPVSVALQNSGLRPINYDRALEMFSMPLMNTYAGHWSFGEMVTAPDGVTTNFHFSAYNDAGPAWRHIDLTGHVVFLASATRHALLNEMDQEARYLQRHDAARANLKNVIEGPNADLDRIIRSVVEMNGTISNALRKQFPLLDNTKTAADAVEAIMSSINGTDASSSTT